MKPVVDAARALGREVGRRVEEIRSQAPGARMVGEWTVKFSVSRLKRALGLSDEAGPTAQKGPDE